MNEQNNKELNNEAMEAVEETKEQAAANKEADEKKSDNKKKGFGEKVKGAVVGAWNSPVGRGFRKGAKIVGAVTILGLAVLGGVGFATSRRGDSSDSGDPSSDGLGDIGCDPDDMFEEAAESAESSSEHEETEESAE